MTVGVIAVDGTKITASASNDSDRDYEQIVREILEEAERLDLEEDELHGDARGDELPEHLQTAAGRSARCARPSNDSSGSKASRTIPVGPAMTMTPATGLGSSSWSLTGR